MSQLDNYYLNHPEPNSSCLLSLKEFILSIDPKFSTAWKYGMPFFFYQDKRICYLWVNKKTLYPYIGFVDGNKMNHKELISEERIKMKVLPINPHKDLPIQLIKKLILEAIQLSK